MSLIRSTLLGWFGWPGWYVIDDFGNAVLVCSFVYADWVNDHRSGDPH